MRTSTSVGDSGAISSSSIVIGMLTRFRTAARNFIGSPRAANSLEQVPVEQLGMEGQTEQVLCERTGGDFRETRDATGPVPVAQAENTHLMLPAQRRPGARAIEMVIKLVGEKN